MTEMARKLRKKSMTLSRTAPYTESGINATWEVIAVHVYRAASSYEPDTQGFSCTILSCRKQPHATYDGDERWVSVDQVKQVDGVST